MVRRAATMKRNHSKLPPLPKADANGYFPAAETARTVLARKLIRRRRAVKLTQIELAKRAGVRLETLRDLEQATRVRSSAAVVKIDKALKLIEARLSKLQSGIR